MGHLKSFGLGLMISVLILFSALGGAAADRLFVMRPLDALMPSRERSTSSTTRTQPAPSFAAQEDTIVQVVENASPAVVTVAIKKDVVSLTERFFDPFELFGYGSPTAEPETQTIQQDIGTGFVVESDTGLIVTNRHVVGDVQAEYRIIDSSGTEYNVTRIYRDPVNDLAILQTDARLPALPLADSDTVQIGQTAIAIGTPLGEFRQTVTLGIVSGLGRGIEASDGFQLERIDNLIQTDAAINPGNSGGPLLNSTGEVMGVNVAVAQAENIGFAIPINVVKASLENFQATGQFDRPMLGVQYKMIPKETALLNDVPEGAYITEVVPNSTAAQLNLQVGDIIIRIDSQTLADVPGGLAGIINQKRIGDTITVQVWRNGQLQDLSGTLQAAPNN